MSTKEQQLQDKFLNTIRKERVPVSMFLVNGIKLIGHIESFDQFVLMLHSAANIQLVYKHAIPTVAPSRDVELAE